MKRIAMKPQEELQKIVNLIKQAQAHRREQLEALQS